MSGAIGCKLVVLVLTVMPMVVMAEGTCHGRWVNPISDVCWSCILPISIGNTFNFGKGKEPKKRDTKNPSSPLCACSRLNVPIVPGIAIGFWEPVRLIDITRTPYCMVNLGGIELGSDVKRSSSYSRGYGKHHAHKSFYHVHYYVYPLLYWLELLTDFACLEEASMDVAYMSEYDITWNDEKMQTVLNPEVFLFGNIITQAACMLDCAAATIDMPRDEMFWCAGCWGNIYPFSGANADHVGGIQSSSLYSARILAKMHRVGLAEETSTSSGKHDGDLCRKRMGLKIKKSQYKLQLVNPTTSVKGIGCWPLGLSDQLYSSFKEYPYDGQDFGYLVWRKRNCCLL